MNEPSHPRVDGRIAKVAATSEEPSLPTRLLSLTCCALLVACCFGSVLFHGEQFAFRDAAHFYYPLHYRVQQQWAAGELPLWEPGENGGVPLLGSPTAAVLYPGKILFAVAPYAWAVRLYVVVHELLAFGAMFLLARSLGISGVGAGLAALSYAFGGVVLSNHFNVIYLVGAAWAPLGFHAVDGWLRRRQRLALLEWALVLAMQVLGGDTEAAYVTVLCAFGYAIGLSLSGRLWPWILGLAAVLLSWAWVGPPLASWVRGLEPRLGQLLLVAAWIIGILVYTASRPREDSIRLRSMLLGLAGACVLALALAGTQVLPAIVQIGGSVRWTAAGLSDLYDSSLLPYRAVEWIWPNVFGAFTAGNQYWMSVLPPAGAHRPWPLSLYLGALPVILAACGAGFRNGPAWRGWMTSVAILSLLASLGEFAGPSRWLSTEPTPTLGDGTFHGLLTTVLPVFRLFRLPYKLLVFSNLVLSVLAGAGWDRIVAGPCRGRGVLVAVALLALSVLTLSAVAASRARLIAALAASPEAGSSVFGPLDAPGAAAMMIGGLAHGAIALAASALVIVCAGRRSAWHGPAALLLVTADLAIANGRLIISVPQAEFEQVPAAVQAIRNAEKAEPSPGPFRVHRLDSWVPVGWSETGDPRRLRELVRWEIDTLQPRFGLLHGIAYLLNDESRTGQYDYWRFFQPTLRPADDRLAATLGVPVGQRVLWHPRQAFDLWGARYFILPSYPADWTSANRGYAAFLDRTELIYPDPAAMEGPAHQADRMRWLKTQDVQVRRNRSAFPRAWVVHQAHLVRPAEMRRTGVRDALATRLQQGTAVQRDRIGLPALDLRTTAYVEADDPESLVPFLSQEGSDPAESVTLDAESPTSVILKAHLRRPGMVVLADAFDPDWRLTIDDRPAPVLPANLLMRAAPVPAGSHTLAFTYRPRSVQVGAAISLMGWILLLTLAAAGLIQQLRRRTRPGEDPTNAKAPAR